MPGSAESVHGGEQEPFQDRAHQTWFIALKNVATFLTKLQWFAEGHEARSYTAVWFCQ